MSFRPGRLRERRTPVGDARQATRRCGRASRPPSDDGSGVVASGARLASSSRSSRISPSRAAETAIRRAGEPGPGRRPVGHRLGRDAPSSRADLVSRTAQQILRAPHGILDGPPRLVQLNASVASEARRARGSAWRTGQDETAATAPESVLGGSPLSSRSDAANPAPRNNPTAGAWAVGSRAQKTQIRSLRRIRSRVHRTSKSRPRVSSDPSSGRALRSSATRANSVGVSQGRPAPPRT
jgi:hypothetical protein